MTSSSRIQLYLLVASFMVVIAGFIVLAQWGGAPPGSTYIPAHIEDGKLVPGETKPRRIEVSPEPPHEFVPPHPDRS